MSFDKINITGTEYEFQDGFARNQYQTYTVGQWYTKDQFVAHDGIVYKVTADRVQGVSESTPATMSGFVMYSGASGEQIDDMEDRITALEEGEYFLGAYSSLTSVQKTAIKKGQIVTGDDHATYMAKVNNPGVPSSNSANYRMIGIGLDMVRDYINSLPK